MPGTRPGISAFHGPQRKSAIVVPVLFTVLFLALSVINPPFIDEQIETLLLDFRFKLRNLLVHPHIPDDILIVAVDEKSLAEYGRWPWSRKIQGRLIDAVCKGGPKAAAVDVFYPEPESPQNDRYFADVLSAHRDRLVVALGFEAEQGKKFTGDVPDQLLDQTITQVDNSKALVDNNGNSRAAVAFRVLLPHEPIAGAASFGHVLSQPDRDGKLRRETLFLEYGGEYFPSLSLQTARMALGSPLEKLHIIGGAGVAIGDRFIPTDFAGRLDINYLGPEGTIRHVPAADVLSGRVPPDVFRGKIVVIGTSAIATFDQKITPFSANYPGVEKNATVVANIMRTEFIKPPLLLATMLSVLVCGLLLVFLSRGLNALRAILLFAFATVFIIILNQLLFTYLSVRMNLFYPLATVMSQGVFILAQRYFFEERKARDIRKMFSSYVSPKIVEEIISHPEKAGLGGEKKTITVLFSDLMGFTSISERNPPEKVVGLLNEYFHEMADIIFKWDGTLDKIVGDEIMAFWGAPTDQPDHAERAIRCALDMTARLGEMQKRWAVEGREVLDCGIGINTGEVIIGNIGAAGKKMDYTAIGDHVNIAARVEKLTRQYVAKIIITEFTLAALEEIVAGGTLGHVEMPLLDTVTVKGKEKGLRIYAVNDTREKEKK